MVKRKSSRVTDMNYTYEIQITRFGHQLIVKEQKNGETPDLWSLETLFDSTWNKSDAPSIKSLVRTKEWLKMKHPEIIMKFLIFEDGVYDRNDVPMIFWKFSELNRLFVNEKDSKIISFKRTKDWIIENHPEYLI
jgi:hypothetical protein